MHPKGRGLPEWDHRGLLAWPAPVHSRPSGYTCLKGGTGWQISAYSNHAVLPSLRRGRLRREEPPGPRAHRRGWRNGCLLCRKAHGPALSSLCELGMALPLSGSQFIQRQNEADVGIQ